MLFLKNLNIKNEIKIEIELSDELKNSNETLSTDATSDLSKKSVSDTHESTAIITKLLEDVINKIVADTNTERLRRFKCKKCNFTTIDNYHLKRHLSSMHEDAQVQCLICVKIFDDKFEFKSHFKSCFYNCPYFGCQKKFRDIEKLNAHKRSHVKMLRRLV